MFKRLQLSRDLVYFIYDHVLFSNRVGKKNLVGKDAVFTKAKDL